jgi:uncharacterized repeat protein (TIGR03803 family)
VHSGFTFTCLLWLEASAVAQVSSVLYNFGASSTDGTSPLAALITDSAGNLYGTTQSGGTNSEGTVFELVNSSAAYTESVLYNFGASSNDGTSPLAALIMDSAGDLSFFWGVTLFRTRFPSAVQPLPSAKADSACFTLHSSQRLRAG